MDLCNLHQQLVSAWETLNPFPPDTQLDAPFSQFSSASPHSGFEICHVSSTHIMIHILAAEKYPGLCELYGRQSSLAQQSLLLSRKSDLRVCFIGCWSGLEILSEFLLRYLTKFKTLLNNSACYNHQIGPQISGQSSEISIPSAHPRLLNWMLFWVQDFQFSKSVDTTCENYRVRLT